MASNYILEVKNLHTHFLLKDGVLKAVNGISFQLERGTVFGIVGESGSGKTMTALSILGLVPEPGQVVMGEILYQGRDLLRLGKEEMRRIRGKEIAMVFQDAMASLNPIIPVGVQVEEMVTSHMSISKREARRWVLRSLREAGLSDPETLVKQYPFQLSGGMCQRVMLAMAMALTPPILIADEPTAGLDTTLQAQILGHLKDLQQQGLSIILISHDLGVVAQMAYRVGVMYAGSLVEITTTAELFQRPAHPYTAGLLRSVPRLDHPNRRLTAVRGTLPSLINLPDQCPFLSRCYKATSECRTSPNPALSPTGPDHLVACYNQVRHE